MDLGIRDRGALVFGGGGLGGAIARSLAEEGARIAVADIDGKRAGATCDAIAAGSGRAVPIRQAAADPRIETPRALPPRDGVYVKNRFRAALGHPTF